MRIQLSAFVLVLCISSDLIAQGPSPPIPRRKDLEPLPSDPVERDRELNRRQMEDYKQAEREAAERQRVRERNEEMRLPNARERAAKRERDFRQFQKNVETFFRIADRFPGNERKTALTSDDLKTVRRNAKDLGNNVSKLLWFLLDGNQPPDMSSVHTGEAAESRLGMLMSLIGPVKEGLQIQIADPKRVDVGTQIALLRDLEALKALSDSLARCRVRSNLTASAANHD
jgi:hypothetical protein